MAERDDLKAKLDVEREARHTAAAHLQQRINDLTAKEVNPSQGGTDSVAQPGKNSLHRQREAR
jgi:hypothetical protein